MLALGLLLGLVPTVAGASSWTFGTPTADSTFGKGIVFSQPITIDKPIGRAEILLTVADAIGPTVFALPSVPSGSTATLTYTLDTSGNDHMIPNTPILAQWRIVSAGQPAEVALGPQQRVIYDDDRFQWKSTSDELVRVHWYEGDAAFGAKALKLGADEVRKTSKLLGVTESDPIDFFVYANVDDFYGAIGPGRPRERGGLGLRRDPDLARVDPAGPDEQLAGRRRGSRRVRPHGLRHRVEEPVSQPAALAHRGSGRLPERGLWVVGPGRGPVGRAGRVADPARRADRPVPERSDFFLAYSESVSSIDSWSGPTAPMPL